MNEGLGAVTAAPRRQAGVVLLGLLVIAVTASSFVLLKALNAELALRGPSARSDETERHARLAEARAALIAYAVSYPERNVSAQGPGRFPCPALGLDGVPASNCGGVNPTTGRLPYREFAPSGPDVDPAMPQAPPFVDTDAEPLWYAVADSHRYTVARIDPDTGDADDDLSLDGAGDILAMVISPGPPLPGQNRRATPTAIGAFLEGPNAMPADGAFTALIDANHNDRVAVITRSQLNRAMARRVAGTVREVLTSIYTAEARLPYLAPFDAVDPAADYVESGLCAGKLPVTDIAGYVPVWLSDEWAGQVLIAYGDVSGAAPACADALSLTVLDDSGTSTLVEDVAGVVVVAGRAIEGLQTRGAGPPALREFFERDNANDDRIFEQAPRGNDYNDVTLRWELPP